jgi:hypothetical protein
MKRQISREQVYIIIESKITLTEINDHSSDYASGLMTAHGFLLQYANNFGCIQDVTVFMTYPPSDEVMQFSHPCFFPNCKGGKISDVHCKRYGQVCWHAFAARICKTSLQVAHIMIYYHNERFKKI